MRKRVIYALSIALVFLLALNLLLRGGLFSKTFRTLFIQKVEETTRTSISAGKVRLSLFPPSLIAEDIEIRESRDDKVPLLTAGTIQITFSIWSLLTEVLVIHKVQIQNAEFRIRQKEDGKGNVELLNRFGRAPAPGGRPRVALQNLSLSNASIDLIRPDGATAFRAKQVDLRVDADLRMEHFQIKGQGKDIFLALKDKRSLNLTALEWKLAASPERLEIKNLTASARESSATAKGTIQFPSPKDRDGDSPGFRFQVETAYRIDLRPFRKQIDFLSGNAQWTGSVSERGAAEGTVMAPRIFVEKKRPVAVAENLRSHFLLSSDTLVLDPLSADLFNGKFEGALTAAFGDPEPAFTARFTLSDLSLEEPVRLAIPQKEPLAEGKRLALSGEARLAGPQFEFSRGHFHFRVTGRQPGALSGKEPFWENGLRLLTFLDGDLDADSESLSFTNVSIDAGTSTLFGEGRLDSRGQIASKFMLRVGNAGEITTLLGYPQWGGEIELQGVAKGTADAPVFEADGKVRDGRFKGHPLGEGKTRLAYENRELRFSDILVRYNGGLYKGEGALSWDQARKTAYRFDTTAQNGYPNDIIQLFYERLPLDVRANGSVTVAGVNKDFSVEGTAEVNEGTLYDIAFDHGNVRFDVNSERVRFSKISLESGLSSASGLGEINYQGGYAASVSARNLRLEDLTFVRNLTGIQGLFSGEIEGEGTFSHPHLVLTGNIPALSYRSQTLEQGDARIVLEDQRAEIHAGFKGDSVRLDGSVSIAPPYSSNLILSGKEIPLSPLLALSYSLQSTSIQGFVTGTIDLEGPLARLSDVTLKARLSRLSANLSGYEIANKDDISFRIHNRELTIDSFRLSGEGTSLNISGGLVFFKQVGLFVSGEADLGLVKSFQKIITQGIGKAYLALKISDQWTDPKIQGGLTVQDGQIRVTFLRETVQISNLGLFFNERQILLENLDGSLGEGSFHGTGKMDFEGFRPGGYGFMLESSGMRLTPFSGWTSNVSGNLFLKGTRTEGDLQGEVTLSQGEYNTKFDLKAIVSALARSKERKEPVPYFGDTRLNVKITGDDNLKINNNIARVPFSLDLTLRGTVDHPALVGRIEADSGSVQFSNNTFNLISATVDFTNPEFIEPLIDVKAESTVATAKDRTYQISLLLSGTPDRLEPTLTADDPSLTKTDILALLLSGKRASDLAQTPAGQQTLPVPLIVEAPLVLPGAGQVSFEPVASSLRSGAAPRISVEQRLLGNRFTLSYAYSLNPTQDQIIKMEYLLNRNVSLQGSRDEFGYIKSNLNFRFEFK